MTLTYYHNPRCSKSREGLKLLEDKGLELTIVKYLETPPDVAGLKKLAKLLGVKPREMMRSGEKIFKELGLDDPKTRDADLFAAMAQHPVLIERPILVAGQRAVIGRPPDRVLEIL